MTRPSIILDHLNPSKITPSGWINSIGLLAWCAVGAFFAGKLADGLLVSIGVGLVAFVALAYALALAIWYSNDYDETYG
jgi:membrane protein implicated in regulation of membrane protease activity